VSPDGQRVAFVHYDSTGTLTGKVSVVDQSGVVTPLTPTYVNIHGLTWRGNEIVFTGGGPLSRSVRAVLPGDAPRVISQIPSNVTVWDALPDGRLLIAQTDDRTVTNARFQGEEGDRDLSWLDASRIHDLSSDGNFILFTEFGLGGGSEYGVYLRGTDGSPAVRLGDGNGLALSPDNRWATSMEAAVPGERLVLLPTGTGETRTLEKHGLEYFDARWLPDGKRMVVLAREPGLRPQLFLYVLDGGRPSPLTPEGIVSWAMSTDGTTLAGRISGSPLRLYGVDGGPTRDVPGVTANDVPIAWLSDGLLVMRPTDPATPFGEAYKVDTTTGNTKRWQNILPRDRAGIMAFQSFRITPDGRTQAFAWHRSLSNLYLADGLM
jgi:dipeptidyl aminopeptidase/acylaminoacyl peptidase